MFSDPQSILGQVAIKNGSIACDIGAGSGAYSMALSTLVGDKGRVYAVDIQKEVLIRLASDAKSKNRYNIEVIWGDAEKMGGTKIRDGLCDIVVVANIFFQVEQRDVFISEISRILHPQGMLIFIDWQSGTAGGFGPSQNRIIPKEKARTLFESKGFSFEKDVEAGAQHYGMIFIKK